MALPFLALLAGAKGIGLKALLVKVGIISKSATATATIGAVAAIGVGAAIWCAVRPRAVALVNRELSDLNQNFRVTEAQFIGAEVILNSALEAETKGELGVNLMYKSAEEFLQQYLVVVHGWNEYFAAAVAAIYLTCAALAEEEQEKRERYAY